MPAIVVEFRLLDLICKTKRSAYDEHLFYETHVNTESEIILRLSSSTDLIMNDLNSQLPHPCMQTNSYNMNTHSSTPQSGFGSTEPKIFMHIHLIHSPTMSHCHGVILWQKLYCRISSKEPSLLLFCFVYFVWLVFFPEEETGQPNIFS